VTFAISASSAKPGANLKMPQPSFSANFPLSLKMMDENALPSSKAQPLPTEEASLPSNPEPAPTPKPKKKLGLILFTTFFLIGIVISGYFLLLAKKKAPLPPSSPPDETPVSTRPLISQGKFAEFPEISVKITPQVTSYQVKSDFSNIENFADFSALSEAAKEKLIKNAFVVTPRTPSTPSRRYDEFFPLYEDNSYPTKKIPSFVTTDSIVHSYHLLFNYLLRSLETKKLSPLLKELNQEMFIESQKRASRFQGSTWENAALRNVAFFSVAGKLLNDKFVIPDQVKKEVELELKLIEKRGGILISPVANFGFIDADGKIINPALVPTKEQLKANKEDYTQYLPRGHYEKSDLLKRYFKAMMWLGRITFRFKNDDEIKSAVLAVSALKDNSQALAHWESIYEITNFFVGKSDDIGFYELSKVVNEIYGKGGPGVYLSENNFAKLKAALKDLEPPALNSMPIYNASLQPDREKEIKGFRFMGQRFTIDASIFQRLIYREVGDKTRACPEYDPKATDCYKGARCLPKGLDIPAALGSTEALTILETQEETKYACYLENHTKMKTYLVNLSQDVWTQNLYWSWLYSLHPLTKTRGSGYPTFMTNKAWLRKQLNTFLGSWTELKHDTILYAKQVYAEMGGALKPVEKDDRGYVEPEPRLYARLAALTRMTREGLSSRNLLEDTDRQTLKTMEELCLKLKTIAEKELRNELLTDEEFNLIRTYGGNLEHLFIQAMRDECQGLSSEICLDDNPAALVADVATDPNGQVLEEGIGKIFPIYVVVPVEGKLRIAKGGVFSHYEFPWPMTDRLTDSKWQALVNEDKTPSLPSWTQSFLAD
jgi:hypothetical protein